MTIRNFLLAAVTVLALLVAARYFRPSALPAGRVEVTGTVFLDGSPLTGMDGWVVMGLKEAGKGRPAAGLIDAKGRYRVDTFKRGDGLPPGRYGVAVTAWQRSTAPASAAEGGLPAPASSAVPAKYEDATTSGLTVEVTSEPRQTIDLQLKSK